MQSVFGRIVINNIHTVVVIILNLFDFSNLKRVLSSNHLRNFCPPRTLYNHDLSFFVYGIYVHLRTLLRRIIEKFLIINIYYIIFLSRCISLKYLTGVSESESESEIFILSYFRPRRLLLRPYLVAVAEATCFR